MVSLVNSHTNATRIGWHLWKIDLRFAPGLPPGTRHGAFAGARDASRDVGGEGAAERRGVRRAVARPHSVVGQRGQRRARAGPERGHLSPYITIYHQVYFSIRR